MTTEEHGSSAGVETNGGNEPRGSESETDGIRAGLRLLLALQSQVEKDPSLQDEARRFAQWLQQCASSGADRGWFASGLDRGEVQQAAEEVLLGKHRRTSVSLGLVGDRAALKAEACRAAAKGATPGDEETTDILDRAKRLQGCWVWMFQPTNSPPSESVFQQLAGSYQALSNASRLCERIVETRASDESVVCSVYHLLAEAQSAVWVGLHGAGIGRDQDQMDAFVWLRERTRDERVYIGNFMRREDPADPSNWEDLIARIDRITSTLPPQVGEG